MTLRAMLAIVTSAQVALACASRAGLPAPEPPFTRTPDAPFRSRRPVTAIPTVPDLPATWMRLDNGLTFIHVPLPGTFKVSVEYVNRLAGEITTEYPTELVRLTALALVRAGTRWSDGRTIADIDVSGSRISVSTFGEDAHLELTVTPSSLQEAVRSMARTVREPAFSSAAVSNLAQSLAAAIGR